MQLKTTKQKINDYWDARLGACCGVQHNMSPYWGKAKLSAQCLWGCCKASEWEECTKGCPKEVPFLHLQRWELRAPEHSWREIKVLWRKAQPPPPISAPFYPSLQLRNAPWPWDSHGGAQMELGCPSVFAVHKLFHMKPMR